MTAQILDGKGFLPAFFKHPEEIPRQDLDKTGLQTRFRRDRLQRQGVEAEEVPFMPFVVESHPRIEDIGHFDEEQPPRFQKLAHPPQILDRIGEML